MISGPIKTPVRPQPDAQEDSDYRSSSTIITIAKYSDREESEIRSRRGPSYQENADLRKKKTPSQTDRQLSDINRQLRD